MGELLEQAESRYLEKLREKHEKTKKCQWGDEVVGEWSQLIYRYEVSRTCLVCGKTETYLRMPSRD